MHMLVPCPAPVLVGGGNEPTVTPYYTEPRRTESLAVTNGFDFTFFLHKVGPYRYRIFCNEQFAITNEFWQTIQVQYSKV